MAVTPESLTPATARKAVVFCCDANYQRYALTAAARDNQQGRTPTRMPAEFKAAHFPTHPPVVVGKGLAPDSGKMRRMPIKDLPASRAMARCLARFPDPLTVQP